MMKFRNLLLAQRAVDDVTDTMFDSNNDAYLARALQDRLDQDSRSIWNAIEQAVLDRDAARLKRIVNSK
jgi:hypothetical protein